MYVYSSHCVGLYRLVYQTPLERGSVLLKGLKAPQNNVRSLRSSEEHKQITIVKKVFVLYSVLSQFITGRRIHRLARRDMLVFER